MQALPETGGKAVHGTELHKMLQVKSSYREWVKRGFNDIVILL